MGGNLSQEKFSLLICQPHPGRRRYVAWNTADAGYGNKHVEIDVAVSIEPSIRDGGCDQEDPTTTTPLAPVAPVSMAHLEQYTDGDWVEPTDELTGTAVFDATGDKTTMPSWDELVRQHADRVYRLAYRLSGNQHDAEDLTQETFIRVFRSVQNYQPGTFEGWLHRITTNLFLDMVRRRGRIRMEALPEDYDRVPADEPNPEQIYHDSRLGPDLQAALDSLPPEFRAAVVLVRHRRPVLRGDRRHAGRQAGHRAQPDPPRPPGAARLPGRHAPAIGARHGQVCLSVRGCRRTGCRATFDSGPSLRRDQTRGAG